MRRLLAIVLLLSASLHAQDLPVGPRWYSVSLNGTRVGSIQTDFQPAQVEGAPGWKYTFEIRIKMALEKGESSTTQSSELLCRADLSPLHETEREDDNGQVRTKSTRFEATRVVQDQEFLGRKTTIEVPYEGPIVEEQELFLFAMAREGRLAAGERFEYVRVSTEHRRTHEETMTIEGEVAREDGTRGFKVRIADELQPGVEFAMLVDDKGRILEGTLGPFVLEAATAEEAATLAAGAVAVPTMIPLARPVAAEHLGAIRSMDVEVILASEIPVQFPTDAYQEVLAREGKKHTIRLRPNQPSPAAGLSLPVADPALAIYLRETEQYQSGAPEIETQSAEIVKGEKDPAGAARKLGQWVYQNLEKLSNASALSAVETLRQKKGDCTEHASLYVGLARAAGVPSRSMSGLLFTGNAFGRHAWSESWVGAWMPVDAAWGRFGTPPFYLSFGPESDEAGVSRGDALEMTLMNGFEIRIVSLDLGGQVFDASDPASAWSPPEDAEAIRERVYLTSGLSFEGELAGVDGGRLDYRTAYGRTLLPRTSIDRIEFVRPGHVLRNDAIGLSMRFEGAPWRPDDAQTKQLGVLCFVMTPAQDAAALVRNDEYTGNLDGYFEAARAIVKGARAEGAETERIELGRGDRKTPAIVWRVTAPPYRYQITIWQWRGKAFRLACWSSEKDFETYRPAFDATLRAIELLEK